MQAKMQGPQLPSIPVVLRMISDQSEAQRALTASLSNLAASHEQLLATLAESHEKLAESQRLTQSQIDHSQSQIDQLIGYTKNRDKDLEFCACTSMFNFLDSNFDNATLISERTFYSNEGRALCEFDGGVTFDVIHGGGVQGHYLALLEAKQNSRRFPSFTHSADRLGDVENVINSKELIPLIIAPALRRKIESQREFAGNKVILFYAASNLDANTRANYFSRNISIISPNGSNFNVELAPGSIQR